MAPSNPKGKKQQTRRGASQDIAVQQTTHETTIARRGRNQYKGRVTEKICAVGTQGSSGGDPPSYDDQKAAGKKFGFRRQGGTMVGADLNQDLQTKRIGQQPEFRYDQGFGGDIHGGGKR